MSLYGALYAGVGGLKAQGTKIGIISDNISNVNTTGYKSTKAAFETLVVNTGSNVTYSPGGVIANSVQLVDKQGILTATDAPTDVAISGKGFFAVNSRTDGSGEPLYTRAGAFRQDDVGNFVNPAGFYLQGWPLDRDGRLPGEPGNLNTTSSANLDSLETVNIETLSGVASGTTQVSMGANLDAGEEIHPGSGIDIGMDINNSTNYGITGSSLIIPDEFSGAPVNDIARGDAFTVATGNGLSYTFNYGGIVAGRSVTTGAAGDGASGAPAGPGNIFDATSATMAFFGTSGAPAALADRTFTITTGAGGSKTFTYVTSSPEAGQGEFNNLSNLATAIDQTIGLTARVVDGRLYVGPEDANDSMTFANGGAVDWVAELDMAALGAGSNRFNSMNSLATQVNNSDGLSANVTNPLSDATLRIFVDDPLDTISFYDGTDADITDGENTGSLINEFGFNATTHANYVDGGADVQNAVSNIAPAYDAAGTNGQNLASGDITADFSRNVRVYDALGGGHDLRVSFLKIADNTWAVEIHAIPATEVNSLLSDGQVAVGTIRFNGDGSLRSISTSLTSELTVVWSNSALPSEITFDWGTAGFPFGTVGAPAIGLTDGLSQFDSDYRVAFVNQNGAPVGELIGVNIDEEGYIIASYSNGETQRLYKLPVADFSNPNGLTAKSGNVYAQSQASGEVNLREAGTSGVGEVVSAALEASNVELSEELTDMIVAQRAYQASAKVISTSDELLEELNRL